MRRGRWIGAALSLETRQALAYRVDFWVDFLGSLAVQVGLAFFLWRAVLEARGTDSVGGLSFHALMLYYLMVPLVEKVTRGHEMGFLSRDIYEGTLNRYLVYPVDVFVYKYVQHAAIALVAFGQMALGLTIAVVGWGVPEPFALTPLTVLAGLVASAAASLLYYLMAACLEMVAFWADNVWSLLVMQRFAIRLLGGGMIPLALFPEWSQAWLDWLPFASLLSFPIEAFLGQLGPVAYLRSLAICLGWVLAFSLVVRAVWARGSVRYAGVGI